MSGWGGGEQEGAQSRELTGAAAAAVTLHSVEVSGAQSLSHGMKGQPLPRDPPGSIPLIPRGAHALCVSLCSVVGVAAHLQWGRNTKPRSAVYQLH